MTKNMDANFLLLNPVLNIRYLLNKLDFENDALVKQMLFEQNIASNVTRNAGAQTYKT